MSVNHPFGSNPFDGPGPPPGVPAPPHIPPPGHHQEVNTLATLSVVFAFVFAPAGAILGHLGLGQIAASGQRGRERALVGVTLSYALIVAAVVALVVWAGLRGNVTTHAAGPTTTTSAVAATTTTTVAPPPPTVAPADLAGLLPSVDDDKKFIDDQNLAVTQTMTQITPDTPDTSPVADRDECYGLLFGASAHAYDGTGVTGFYGTELDDKRDPANPTLTAQVVAAFSHAAAARAQLKGQLDKWPACANATLSYSRPDGHKISFASASIVDAGNGITTVELRQVTPVLPGPTVRVVHALAAKANVVIDVQTASRATGTIQSDAALAIVNLILDKIPGPR